MAMLQAQPPFFDEIRAFVRQDRVKPPLHGQILFVGSSSFRLWADMQKSFPHHEVLNRGFGGSCLPDVIRYADTIIFPYKPKQIVIYCGENDLAADPKVSAKVVFSRFRTLFRLIRHKMPSVPIVYVSMKPSPSRQNLMPKMLGANRRIERYLSLQRATRFANVYPLMLYSKGEPRRELFVEDRLHMNENGYAIWAKVIEPMLLLP